MFIISTPEFIRFKQLYENSKYYIIIKDYELIKQKLESFSIRERLILHFYYVQSLQRTGNINTILNTIVSVEEEYLDINLYITDRLIYFIIMLYGYGAIGDIDKELSFYYLSKEFIKKNRNELLNSKDNFWYYLYNNISATVEIKEKNYSAAYDTLKQNMNHFKNITEKSNSDKLMIAQTNLILGQLHKKANYLEIAVKDFKDVIEWSLQIHNSDYVRTGYLNLALTYEEQGKEYLTIQTCNEMIQQIKKIFDSDQFLLSSAYNLLGNIYNRLGEFEQAKEYYLNAFSVVTDSIIIERIKSFNLNNMGVVSFKLGDYQGALIYYLQALEIAKAKNDPFELPFYYSNYREAYLELNKLDEALENELQSVNNLNILKNDDLLVETYLILVRICSEQKDYEKADKYINEINSIWLKTKKNIYNQKYKLATAIKLKKELKFHESKAIFLSVLEESKLNFDLEILALTELAGMTLYSILKFKSGEYNDLENIGLKLMKIAKQKNSLPVICTVSILLSRIKIIELQFNSAERYLQEAYDICVERNVGYFKKRIEFEIQFCSEVKWVTLSNPEIGKGLLMERISSSEIIRRIRDLQRLMLTS